jgi:hypothetical protein
MRSSPSQANYYGYDDNQKYEIYEKTQNIKRKKCVVVVHHNFLLSDKTNIIYPTGYESNKLIQKNDRASLNQPGAHFLI